MGKTIVVSLLFILGLHVLGIIYDFYYTIWWYDIPMHVFGGAWVALLFFHLFCRTFRIVDCKNIFPAIIVIVSFVALIGVLWEFYEYLSDVYIFKIHSIYYAPNPIALPDAMKDLLDDLIGGTIASFILFFRFKCDSSKE